MLQRQESRSRSRTSLPHFTSEFEMMEWESIKRCCLTVNLATGVWPACANVLEQFALNLTYGAARPRALKWSLLSQALSPIRENKQQPVDSETWPSRLGGSRDVENEANQNFDG